jgi:ribose 5-phosphate isomerase B
MKKILIASDHAGFKLKEQLKGALEKAGFRAQDLGTYSEKSCDYPDLAYSLAGRISRGAYKQGILICKSGIGSAIMANRLPAVRAALCYNIKAARFSREHNDSNILVLGAAFVDVNLAKRILKVWLNTDFQGGRHIRRLNKIKKFEREIRSRQK